MSAWFSGEDPSMPYGLPEIPMKATLPAYAFASASTTGTSCWQWGHQLANTSRNTGVLTLARSNGPASDVILNVGATEPTVSFVASGLTVCEAFETTPRFAKPIA